MRGTSSFSIDGKQCKSKGADVEADEENQRFCAHLRQPLCMAAGKFKQDMMEEGK